MGVIQQQAIKGTIYTYLGVVLGFITSVIIFPRFLKIEEIGLLSILMSYTMIFAQFSSLGFNSVTSRLFPYFRNNENKHNGFLFIALSVSLVGFILGGVVFFVLKEFYFDQRESTSLLLNQYIFYVIPLTFFTLFFNALDNYYKVLFKSVQGLFLKEFLQKMLTLLSVLLFALRFIHFNEFVFLYVSAICLPTIIISILIIRDRQFNIFPKPGFISKEMAKTMFNVALFGIIAGATGIVTLNIDRIMIESFLGLGLTGIYTTTFYFGTLIIMPSRSLLKVASIYIADAWKENNIQVIREIYYKSSLNQFIIALLLLIGIWVNIDNIFYILPEEFHPGKYVILWISIAYLFDMILGVGGSVIGLSKYYKNQTYFMFLQVVFIIITNYFFIPLYGIVGAAFATALSKFAYNLFRYVYIYFKFDLQPVNIKYLYILFFGFVAYFIASYIPHINNFIVDILVRSSILLLIYITLILTFKVSKELNDKFNVYLHLFNIKK